LGRTLFATALTATTLLGACQPSSQTTSGGPPEQTAPIRTAHSSWIEEAFQTAIVSLGLEELGYTVEEPKELDYPALYLALANGDLDYSVIYYQPGHREFFDNSGGEEKLSGLGSITPDGVQGYQIDRKTAEEHNITNVEQLQDPAIAKLFDSDGDGQANLVGCNPGWNCELVIEQQREDYGLEDTVEHDRGSYVALLADAITRYEQGGSILFYAYNPHWISAVLKPGEDVVWLEVPFTIEREAWVESGADTTFEGKNLGFPRSDQQIVVNRKFIEGNPIAQQWFELVQIPVADMNEESLRIRDGEDSPDDIRRHAQEWIEANQVQFDDWLAQAEAAGE
jgi:glycine betaine/proline transport system substrate-binding protein